MTQPLDEDLTIPGWDEIEGLLVGMPDLEPPPDLTNRVMAAVQALPLPHHAGMPAAHRHDLARTLLLFAAVLVVGGGLCLFLAPTDFWVGFSSLWELIVTAFTNLLGAWRGLGVALDSVAAALLNVRPVLTVVAIVVGLAVEWRLMHRVSAVRGRNLAELE